MVQSINHVNYNNQPISVSIYKLTPYAPGRLALNFDFFLGGSAVAPVSSPVVGSLKKKKKKQNICSIGKYMVLLNQLQHW